MNRGRCIRKGLRNGNKRERCAKRLLLMRDLRRRLSSADADADADGFAVKCHKAMAKSACRQIAKREMGPATAVEALAALLESGGTKVQSDVNGQIGVDFSAFPDEIGGGRSAWVGPAGLWYRCVLRVRTGCVFFLGLWSPKVAGRLRMGIASQTTKVGGHRPGTSLFRSQTKPRPRERCNF